MLPAVFRGTNYVAVKYVACHVLPTLFAAPRFVVAGVVVWGFLRLAEPKSRLGRGDVRQMHPLITLSGVASGAVLLGEHLGGHEVLGGGIVLVGVYLARRQ